MKITSVIQVLLAVALAICVKAARAQSKGGALWPPIEASTDSEVDSKIDQRSGESGNQKRWRFKYVERNVPGARFYYPSIKKRQNLNSDMDAEVKDSWKISQRPEAQQVDYYSTGQKADSDAEARGIRGRSRGRGRGRRMT